MALAQSTSDAGLTPAQTSQQENYAKRVSEIKYVGIDSFSITDLLDRFKHDKITLARGSQYDPTKTKKVEDVLKQLEAEHGHRFATVRTKVRNISPGDVGITFEVREGPKVF
jgi:outer membrane protein insertion porin family